jgi:hypothetical protein
MLSLPAGVRIWLVTGVTDMRWGLDGLSSLVQSKGVAMAHGWRLARA